MRMRHSPWSLPVVSRRHAYIVGCGLGLAPILLWCLAAANPGQGHDLVGMEIALLQAEALAAAACLLVIRRLRFVGYGLLTLLPVSVFLLLGA